jgi:phospholipid transport system substrate-binding protein
VDNRDPARFIDTLSDAGLGAIRSAGGNRAAARAQFRTLLSQHFAIDQIGDKLIRRWRSQITPQQYAAYKAALPNFLIGAYADRLYDYANADVKIGRVVPRGNSAAVATTVVRPGGQPLQGVWTVQNTGGGYKVTNLTVAGINLTLTQTADFDSFVQRRGFDALVAFMKSKG